MRNMFKVNKKDTRTTSLDLTPLSFIVDFIQNMLSFTGQLSSFCEGIHREAAM